LAQVDEHFTDVGWAPEYFYDMEQRKYQPYPYLGAKPVPLSTTYVNQQGWERRTYRPVNASDRDPIIWMFGGSTTWGVGQRDDHTIASEVARLAEQEGISVDIRNFGQVAWLNWQEMLLFEQLLHTEKRLPDLAVFYDGVNEFAALPPYDQPSPRSFNPNVSVAERAKVISSEPLLDPVLTAYERNSLAHIVWRDVRAWWAPTAGADVASSWSPADEVAAAAENYDRGARLIEFLANERGIETQLFWQPRLGGRERHESIISQIETPIIDISDALDAHPETYFDDMHTNEYGARLVAEELWESLRPSALALDR